ncbi:hypothetical protein CGCA056_v007148 [Colletotrichum aenigma]|uniref:uncharacterized protein n=1 Tax=Colletotrichum aenigma TaxID=1215731 RepID=UPI0018733A07|nr:uncharacterized protein CGCA056_v007148 [Colletotrichum aenigma]KAF5521172.1 hypothetical protein CGCA056_v007148 [Colletotrichum aenigma]
MTAEKSKERASVRQEARNGKNPESMPEQGWLSLVLVTYQSWLISPVWLCGCGCQSSSSCKGKVHTAKTDTQAISIFTK